MVKTVLSKEHLENGFVWDFLRFTKTLNVHEVRFLESMPTGRLKDVDESLVLNRKQRELLIGIQKKSNWSGKYPKVTVFAHTESPDLFGCGAGTQHSYIDASGNLCPCDFVPLSFGSIHEAPIEELWKQMNGLISVPREKCLIMECYNKMKRYNTQSLPLDPKVSKEIIGQCAKMRCLPGFYRTLSGEKK